MLKKIEKYSTIVLVSLLLVLTAISPVGAASFSIKSSASSVSPGGSFTVTVSASGCAGQFTVSASNGSGGGTAWIENGSQSFSIKAGSSGTCTVTATASDVADLSTEAAVTGSKSVSVSIKAASSSSSSKSSSSSSDSSSTSEETTPKEETVVQKSSVNTLSSLSVDKGTLSPEFSKDTTSYSVKLDGNTTKITLSAKASDSKASVSGTGEKKLDYGDNEFSIKCTAEDGSTKTYKITVTVDETPTVFTTYNGQELGFVKNLNDIGLPHKSFEETTITINGEEVTAFHSNQLDKTIVYLVDGDNEESFYLYDDELGVTSKFVPITILGRKLFVVDIDETLQEREGMIYQEIEIDENKLMGWVYEDEALSNYQLVYLMNDKGEMVYYLFETSEEALMLYPEALIEQSDNSQTIIYGLAGLSVVLAVALIGMAIYIRRYKHKSIGVMEDYMEKKQAAKKE